MPRVGLVAFGVGVSILSASGLAHAESSVQCVDMLAFGEPVCDIASGELEFATGVDLQRSPGESVLASGVDLQYALSDFATLAVRLETELALNSDGGPAFGGVGAHAFGILARSDDGARGLGLAVDVFAPISGAAEAEVAVGTTWNWRSASLSGAAGVAAPLENELPVNAFASASLAVPMGPLAFAGFVEARVEGGADPFRVDLAIGLTLHPTETTKLLVAAPFGHGDEGWSGGVTVGFATGIGSPEPATIAVASP